jgi:hypothetical protein
MHCNNSIQYFCNRLCQWRNLLFFVLVMAVACKTEQNDDVKIVWKDNKAFAIEIPKKWIRDINKDAIPKTVSIFLSGDKKQTVILGDYSNDKQFLFQPFIPFTRGMNYEIWVHDKKVSEFVIPFEKGDAPKVITSYPQLDTVPENLLKIYIQFSHPMREGQSAKYIALVKNGTDTLHDVFLDLQPELWNEDRTVMTAWLDPGRIKRDLQPNLKLGAPLHEKEKYKFIVLKNWTDAQGRPLQQDYNWAFITVPRNDQSPDPSQWKLTVPKALSKEALNISFNKTLDHFLLMETLHITDASGKTVAGDFEVMDKDRSCSFTPAEPWAAGKYNIVIESKLEDLSGNNINRPFDRDVTKTKTPSTQPDHTIHFTVQ